MIICQIIYTKISILHPERGIKILKTIAGSKVVLMPDRKNFNYYIYAAHKVSNIAILTSVTEAGSCH